MCINIAKAARTLDAGRPRLNGRPETAFAAKLRIWKNRGTSRHLHKSGRRESSEKGIIEAKKTFREAAEQRPAARWFTTFMDGLWAAFIASLCIFSPMAA